MPHKYNKKLALLPYFAINLRSVKPDNEVPETLRGASPIAERESGGRAVRMQYKYPMD